MHTSHKKCTQVTNNVHKSKNVHKLPIYIKPASFCLQLTAWKTELNTEWENC